MKRINQSGFSVLEQAIALPVLLSVIIAAVDVNSVLQAYSALQSGVRQSLRCLYTTDGKCVNTSPDTRARLYNYFLVQRDPIYLVDQFDLSGNTSWINKPTYRLDNFRAKVLDQVYFDAPTASFSAQKTYFPADRTAQFDLRIAQFPYIKGDPHNPTVRYRGAPSQAYPTAANDDISSIDGNIGPGQSPFVIGYADLPVITRGPSLYDSTNMEMTPSSAHDPNFTSHYTNNFAEIAVHITGFRRGTDDYSHGAVSIDLMKVVGNQLVLVQPLGGRSFGKDSPQDVNPRANFIIRGLRSAWIDPSVANYQELHLYTPIEVDYGAQYKIRFTLHHTNGTNVAWQGERLKVYFPQVLLNQSRTYSCQGGVAACDGASACTIPEVPSSESAVFTNFNLHSNSTPVRYDSAINLGTCLTAPISYQALLSANNISQCEQNFTFSHSVGSCTPQAQVQNCVAAGQLSQGATVPNYGVPELPAPDGFIYVSSSAASICPPNSSSSISIGQSQNVRWSESEEAVPADDIFPGSDGTATWSKDNCNATWQFPSASHLGNYSKLTYSSTLFAQSAQYTGSSDPALLLADPNSGYNCPEFSLASATIDVLPSQVNSGNQNSLFFGERMLPSCNWEEDLRTDGINHNLFDAGVYFKANTPVAGQSKAVANNPPPACVDPNPEQIWSAPTSKTLIPGGPFSEGNKPAQCLDPNQACAAEFFGFGPGTPSSTTYNFSLAAQHFGFSEIQAQYPRAKWNCSGEDCAHISINDSSDAVSADGTLEVPVRLFMGKTVTLKFSEGEAKERKFVR